MEQYIKPTTNFVVKADMSLGEGRSENIAFTQGTTPAEFQPVFAKDKIDEDGVEEMAGESKVKDHYEHA